MPKISLSDATAAAKFATDIGEKLGVLSARTAELVIKNHSGHALTLFATATGQTGGYGSGFFAKNEAPDDTVPNDWEEVCGIESNHAGAIGVVIYHIANDVYAVMYAAAPKQAAERAHVRLVYGKGWAGLSQSGKQYIANTYLQMMDWNDGTLRSRTSAYGYTLSCSLSGYNEIAVTFEIGTDASVAYGLYSVSQKKFLCVSTASAWVESKFQHTHEETRDDQLIWADGTEGDLVVPFTWAGLGGTQTLSFAGVPENEGLQLSYRNITGRVKLWRGFTPWLITEKDGHYCLQATLESQYLWMDDDQPYVTHSGNPDKTSALFDFVKLGT